MLKLIFVSLELKMEVNECRKDQPFEIHHEEVHMVQEEEAATGQESDAPKLSDSNSSPMDTDSNNEKSDVRILVLVNNITRLLTPS